MTTFGRMHPDELPIDEALVRRMVAAEFPRWAGLPVEPVVPVGASHAMYRLGAELVVRIPRTPRMVEEIGREARWLPRLAPHLPAPIPAPVAVGGPVDDCPWSWAVLRWLHGATPVVGELARPDLLAQDLAAFVTALCGLDPTGAPASYRSETLTDRDAHIRKAIGAVADVVDADAATAAWEEALKAPEHPGPPVWIHADLQPGNLLVSPQGRLAAVIDFGCAGLGDPAVDLLPAWYVLPAAAREAFRAAVAADDATWARARGWALSVALMEVSYYRDSNPRMTAIARHVIAEVLADQPSPPGSHA
ncbi:aminoglycoside phosphotransferase family protein [Kitasatospora brasiliensis]|uniref:aminoglycoside phosphotransferase family protein n=1 Tax=Kitasatospora brasiliensis TaxID=3058040 RepID=UPI002931B2B8|nr:aminoglycoside phosphotransferase family protein [Kitasatospora sp. K002]